MELLIGCGNDRRKKICPAESGRNWSRLVTLDISPDCNADVVWDLNTLPYPFPDNTFDEVHAYEVLEHCGRQGDWRFFFDQFTELWRILVPGGLIAGTVPAWGSKWVWADPGHTRFIDVDTFVFLSQSEYVKQVGVTCMTDYRAHYKADFNMIWHQVDGEHVGFILRAIK